MLMPGMPMEKSDVGGGAPRDKGSAVKLQAPSHDITRFDTEYEGEAGLRIPAGNFEVTAPACVWDMGVCLRYRRAER
eukprot:jgi/Chrzof1/365/Cz01g13080.t1